MMEIIHRDTDYAIRAAARLAGSTELLSVTALSEQTDVPVDFLRKIMQRLRSGGLVKSVRGPFGGYSLSRSPDSITLKDIIESVQGPLRMNACFETPEICKNAGLCPLQGLLCQMEEKMTSYLDNVTLANIVRRLESND